MSDPDLTTFAEIAERINGVRPEENLTPKGARMRFVRALKKLRIALAAEGIDEEWFANYMHARGQVSTTESFNSSILPDAIPSHDETDIAVSRPRSLKKMTK